MSVTHFESVWEGKTTINPIFKAVTVKRIKTEEVEMIALYPVRESGDNPVGPPALVISPEAIPELINQLSQEM